MSCCTKASTAGPSTWTSVTCRPSSRAGFCHTCSSWWKTVIAPAKNAMNSAQPAIRPTQVWSVLNTRRVLGFMRMSRRVSGARKRGGRRHEVHHPYAPEYAVADQVGAKQPEPRRAARCEQQAQADDRHPEHETEHDGHHHTAFPATGQPENAKRAQGDCQRQAQQRPC